jgi:osmotically-inducible protein OsmY
MKLIPIVAALALGTALAACDRHPQNGTAYNNSGQTAAVAGTSAPTPTPSVAQAAPATDASASANPGDERTSTKILSEIASSSGMKEADVNVTTTNGAVRLAGKARSQDQVALAMDIAKRQPGVSTVQSEIQVQ